MKMHHISLNKNKRYNVESLNSNIILILQGRISIYINNKIVTLERIGGVFEESAEAFYFPKAEKLSVLSNLENSEFVLISSNHKGIEKDFKVHNDDIVTEKRGKETYCRTVKTIIGNKIQCGSLIVGETYHDSLLSGFPPHRHEKNIPSIETSNKEKYLIKISPNNGCGLFFNYDDSFSNSNISVLSNNDIISVEKGYHSIMSMPNQKFYYLWVLETIDNKFLSVSDTDFYYVS